MEHLGSRDQYVLRLTISRFVFDHIISDLTRGIQMKKNESLTNKPLMFDMA